MPFELATVNYQRFRPEMGVPVQSSNGHPRWPLPYKIEEKAPLTYPPRNIMALSREEFRVHYRAHLERAGVEGHSRVFQAIADRHGGQRLVLLCFEDLTKVDPKTNLAKWCHRTLFAEWWHDQTGIKPREMGPTGPPVDPYHQATLL
jgi:hypothetical protein